MEPAAAIHAALVEFDTLVVEVVVTVDIVEAFMLCACVGFGKVV